MSKRVPLVNISRVDSDSDSYYIAKISKKYSGLSHLSGKGSSPVDALILLEAELDKHIERMKLKDGE